VLEPFQKTLEWGDVEKCYVVNFIQAKKSKYNLFCVIDVNQIEAFGEALETGYNIAMKSTNLKYITPASEGELFNIIIKTAGPP